MHRRILAALTATTVTVLGLSSATSGPAYADRLPPPDHQNLSASIAGLPDDVVTGAQVRVSGRDGSWSGRAGVRDVRTGRPVPDGARFRIGSATKMFTASLVLQLAAEGRLGLDDPVQSWLPGVLPASYATITVGQLLDHTSGLPASTEDAGNDDPAWVVRHRFDWHTPRAVVRSAARQPMAFEPGTKQEYNGVNYFLAGLVVERVTGHAYVHELHARLLEPLGLDDSYLPGRGEVRLRGRHAHGYVRVDGRLVDVTAQSAYAWAEGGMVSTTRDLSRFLGALMAGRVVPQPWLDHMLTVRPSRSSRARATACVRDRASSLRIRLATCDLTVRSAMTSSVAMAPLDAPLAKRRRTSSSRALIRTPCASTARGRIAAPPARRTRAAAPVNTGSPQRAASSSSVSTLAPKAEHETKAPGPGQLAQPGQRQCRGLTLALPLEEQPGQLGHRLGDDEQRRVGRRLQRRPQRPLGRLGLAATALSERHQACAPTNAREDVARLLFSGDIHAGRACVGAIPPSDVARAKPVA